jgi:hypothetical protein
MADCTLCTMDVLGVSICSQAMQRWQTPAWATSGSGHPAFRHLQPSKNQQEHMGGVTQWRIYILMDVRDRHLLRSPCTRCAATLSRPKPPSPCAIVFSNSFLRMISRSACLMQLIKFCSVASVRPIFSPLYPSVAGVCLACSAQPEALVYSSCA